MSTTPAIAPLKYAVDHLAVPAIVVLGHQRCGAVEAPFHPELQLTPSLAQVVGQLRMELFGRGAAEDLEEACRLHAPTRPAIWWIPVFCSPIVCGRVGCRSKRRTTTTTRPGLTGWVPCCSTAFPGISGDGLLRFHAFARPAGRLLTLLTSWCAGWLSTGCGLPHCGFWCDPRLRKCRISG